MFKYPKILIPIENILFRIITVRAKSKLFASYQRYLKSGIVPDNAMSLIIKANFATKGNLISDDKFEINTLDYPSNLFTQPQLIEAVNKLEAQGFAKVGIVLNQKILSELLRLANEPCYPANEKKVKKLEDNPNPSVYHRWHVPSELVLSNLGVQQLFLDNFWKFISDSYLRRPNKISAIRCWHSFVHSGQEVLSPENWHLDNGDGINFIKFFILLSDVKDYSGPTSIVPVSSQNLPRKFFTGRRFSDIEVSKLLKQKKIGEVKATGPVGLVYVADTRLLHRGTPVERGKRFLLNWTVSSDSFGSLKNEKYKIEEANPLFNSGLIEVF